MEIFSYEGSPVTFSNNDGSVMVNATEMARSFGKKPGKWLELSSTKSFISVLSNVRNSDNWVMTGRGNNGGTWMHEDVALEFARWLSPKFAIWCNDRIKELLVSGRASVRSDQSQLSMELLFAEKVSSLLSLNDVSKLSMMRTISDKYGMPDMLPHYVQAEDAALSATELLKKHLPGVKVRDFNARLVELGYLKTLTHEKKNGSVETFRSVTDKGSAFGENFMDSHSHGVTQPKWYEGRFVELCQAAGFEVKGGEL